MPTRKLLAATRRPRAGLAQDAEATMTQGLRLLSEGIPGTQPWFNGLAKVLASPGVTVTMPQGLDLGFPHDKRAPFAWARIARKNGLETDLARALEMAGEIMDGVQAPVLR